MRVHVNRSHWDCVSLYMYVCVWMCSCIRSGTFTHFYALNYSGIAIQTIEIGLHSDVSLKRTHKTSHVSFVERKCKIDFIAEVFFGLFFAHLLIINSKTVSLFLSFSHSFIFILFATEHLGAATVLYIIYTYIYIYMPKSLVFIMLYKLACHRIHSYFSYQYELLWEEKEGKKQFFSVKMNNLVSDRVFFR